MSSRPSEIKIPKKANVHARILIIALILVLVLLFVIPFYGYNKDTVFYSVIGGVIGAISSLVVIIGFILNPKDRGPPLALLFWRSVCDFGLAVRFIASNGFDLMVCGKESCSITDDASNQVNCWVASTMTQFFEMASEGWLLCVGLDLFFSITQPFSSFKSRLKYYHLMVWTYAIIYAIPMIADEYLYGFWYISSDVSSSVVCWIQLGSSGASNIYRLSWKPWVMLYIPLFVIYMICVGILIYSYFRLKRGIPRTVVHRMKALITNSINISIYLFYWFILGWFYGGSYIALDNGNNYAARLLFDALLYLISAKGFSSIIVWITVLNVDIGVSSSTDAQNERLDLNSALRQEVLQFATLGIRCTAREAEKLTNTEVKHFTNLKLNINGTEENVLEEELTVLFFMKLVFGMRKEVQIINAIMRQTSRKFPTINTTVAVPTVQSTELDVTQGDSRMSQRPTVLSTHSNSKGSAEESDLSGHQARMFSAGIAMSTIGSSIEGVAGSRTHSIAVASDTDEEEVYEVDNDHITDQTFVGKICKWFTSKPTVDKLHVEFTEFEPQYFRRVRIAAGVTDAAYISAFKTTIKERLTEGGASGAFFFFSKGEVYIAKSCSLEELDTLTSSAAAYASYMESNKDSYICRIYGAYRLQIYSSSLYFFVMNNLFLNSDDAIMHEKYDIKGSWVARNSTPPRDGQMVTCTHCEQKFVYYRQVRSKKLRSATSGSHDTNLSSIPPIISNILGRLGWKGPNSDTEEEPVEPDRCPFTVKGLHEPNIVLKDNDLKYKIRLPHNTAINLLYQLRKDADFLYSIGVMDFSLLVGVHNTEYEVNTESEGTTDVRDYTNGSIHSDLSRINGTRSSETSIDDERHDTISTIASTDITSPLHKLPIHRQRSIYKPQNSRGGLSPRATEQTKSRRLQVVSSNLFIHSTEVAVSRLVGPESYYVGIIDYQQKWNWNKKLERFLKIYFKRKDPNGLSAIEPEVYRDRFIRHVEDILDLDESDKINSRQNTVDFAVPGGKVAL